MATTGKPVPEEVTKRSRRRRGWDGAGVSRVRARCCPPMSIQVAASSMNQSRVSRVKEDRHGSAAGQGHGSPKHQRQIGTSPTGAFDCGPRSWQMGIDVQTGGLKRPGPTKLRKLARRTGNQTTRAEDADTAVEAFGRRLKGFKEPLRYRVKLRRPWEEAEKALRNRRAVHIAIDYGVVNRNKPEFSSQTTSTAATRSYCSASERRGERAREVGRSASTIRLRAGAAGGR